MKKKVFTFKNLFLASALAFMTSCSDDDGCANCHLVVMNADGSETELLDLEEQCGDDLHDLEENGYNFTDTVYVHTDGMIYSLDSLEVHCGEEHDHDGHDH